MGHARATGNFGRAAEPYARARPAYPAASLQTLARALDLGPGDHVVELGAGTGIFTRQLVETGFRVTAVEPVPAMRAGLAESVDAGIRAGTAEDTGLPEGVADAVVAATAWHWFDAPRALEEVARLLKPGGGLALLWNSYDETAPWVADYADIADRRRGPDQPSSRTGRWRTDFDDLPNWAPLEHAEFANPVPTDLTGLVDRMLSSSAIASRGPEVHDQVRREVREVVTRHGLDAAGTIHLPYVTALYWTRPR